MPFKELKKPFVIDETFLDDYYDAAYDDYDIRMRYSSFTEDN